MYKGDAGFSRAVFVSLLYSCISSFLVKMR